MAYGEHRRPSCAQRGREASTRIVVGVVVLLAPGVAFAQTGDAGVTRSHMQVDYVQSRRRSEGCGGYPHDELIDGRMASIRRHSLTREAPSLSCARLRRGP